MPNGLTSNRCSLNLPNADVHPLIDGASSMPSCISSSVAVLGVICPGTFPLGKRFTMYSGYSVGPPTPYFRQWIRNHQWAALNDALRTLVRRDHGKRSRPTAAILDSQSVKSAGHGGSVGYDAGKRIKGRKRHLLVDTLGLVLGVAVTPASTPERDGAQIVLGRVLGWFTWLRILWVDGGYAGQSFAQWVKALRPKLAVEVVKRSDTTTGFTVLPRRWVVERTFGWLMHQRRLVRDYETTETSAEPWIHIAMIRIQLRRLA